MPNTSKNALVPMKMTGVEELRMLESRSSFVNLGPDMRKRGASLDVTPDWVSLRSCRRVACEL